MITNFKRNGKYKKVPTSTSNIHKSTWKRRLRNINAYNHNPNIHIKSLPTSFEHFTVINSTRSNNWFLTYSWLTYTSMKCKSLERGLTDSRIQWNWGPNNNINVKSRSRPLGPNGLFGKLRNSLVNQPQ